jgi:hypothetical protein
METGYRKKKVFYSNPPVSQGVVVTPLPPPSLVVQVETLPVYGSGSVVVLHGTVPPTIYPVGIVTTAVLPDRLIDPGSVTSARGFGPPGNTQTAPGISRIVGEEQRSIPVGSVFSAFTAVVTATPSPLVPVVTLAKQEYYPKDAAVVLTTAGPLAGGGAGDPGDPIPGLDVPFRYKRKRKKTVVAEPEPEVDLITPRRRREEESLVMILIQAGVL